ncbi:MAG: IS607 family transposase [Candidatus Heimdallarchaeota archaeon]|nr:IS607 family transposase [Candidatus Heimdallarchaeota archaeon]
MSNYLGVSISTLRRWDGMNLLNSSFRTAGGHRRYQLNVILEITGDKSPENNTAIGYAPVSGHKQKKDLLKQMRSIKNYSRKNNFSIGKVYFDFASGLNDNRLNFLRLLKSIPVIRPKAVVITYSDRLARFGVNVIKMFCEVFSCKLITIFQKDDSNLETELAEGVIAVITSYAGRFHRRRRGTLV